MFQSKSNLQPPDQWCRHLNTSLPSTLTTDGLLIDEALGIGKIRYVKIQNGLWTNHINLQLKKPVELIREPNKVNDYFILNFHLSKSKIEHSGNGKAYKLGLENVNILLSSSCTSAKIQVPPNVPIQIFNIGFERSWLDENILNVTNEYLQSLFPETSPIYLSEFIDYRLKHMLKEINIESNNRLSLFSKVLQVLDYFFERLKKREKYLGNMEKIHPDDLVKLMLTKDYMEQHLNETISLEALSKIAGMSLSKYKRLFGQVFGTTPYKYYLESKLQTAMELLLTKKYSCSEVGHLIGYSNLSQFSKAFKKQFDILPKDVKMNF